MMHPKRLSGTAANIRKYFKTGDYYTKGDAETSAWGGRLADTLGLSGPVDAKRFEELLAGRIDENTQLGRRRSNEVIEHHPGWDFGLAAPKSVSIMALVAGDRSIAEAHEKAVGRALDYLEQFAATRVRRDGEIEQETTGKLLYARFTEHASRELDPHLHTHVVVLNVTERENGSFASLETRAMFSEQMTAGQIYRNELAHQLRHLGYEIDYHPRKGTFEIESVPKELIDAFSTRARQINDHAEKHGLAGQAARRESFYETRHAKEKIGHDDLISGWQARALPHLRHLETLTGHDPRRPWQAPEREAAQALRYGIAHGEDSEAVNARGALLRKALSYGVGQIRADDVEPLLRSRETQDKLLIARTTTGDRILIQGRTTSRSARLEARLERHLELAMGDAPRLVSADRIVGQMDDLHPQQQRALHLLALSRDRVVGVTGVAGAGKSTLVKTLVAAAEPQHRFLALAPTSSAAAELGEKANIPYMTVPEFLGRGGGKSDDRTTLVIDEASMLGNRPMLRLLEISRDKGSRLILLGDIGQIAAIDQGKPFWLLQRLGLPTADLGDSLRHETRMIREAAAAARAGDYAAAIAGLDKIVTGKTSDTLTQAVVEDWIKLKPEARAKSSILVLDHASRQAINEQIRTELKREGVVAATDTRFTIHVPAELSETDKKEARMYSGGQVVRLTRDNVSAGLARGTDYVVLGTERRQGRHYVRLLNETGRETRWDPRTTRGATVNVFYRQERDLAEGDRIQWRSRLKSEDLRNAQRGSVEVIDGDRVTILWDKGHRQMLDLGRHKTWDHGYAETVHAAQGKTYDRTFLVAPTQSNLVTGRLFYTALSRSRFGARLYTDSPKKLIDRLERHAGDKTSASEGLGRLRSDRIAARRDGARPHLAAERQADALRRRDETAERARQRAAQDRSLPRHLQRAVAVITEFWREAMKDARAGRAPTEPARTGRDR